MVVYTVFTQNVSTFYKTTLCSKSSFFVIFTTFLTAVIPLLLAYRSQGFWVKSQSYREQPLVNFKQEYFLYIEVADDLGPISCSTIRKKTEALESLDKCSSIKFHEEDSNGDGKPDSLSLNITVTSSERIQVQSVYLVLAFNYILQHQCVLEMEGLAVLQSGVNYPAASLEVMGDLSLLQRTLLPCRGRDLRYNQSAFSDPHVNFQQLVRQHALQNVSTSMANERAVWTRGDASTFSIQVLLTYPEVSVQYRPGFWPVMKWAWMQYFAILAIFVALLRWVKSYVFLNHLLPSIPVRPWKTSN